MDLPTSLFLSNNSIEWKIYKGLDTYGNECCVDNLIRDIIAQDIRINGKIPNMNVLLLIALEQPLKREYISYSTGAIISMLKGENSHNNMQELAGIIIGQIMTKLPKDISSIYMTSKIRIELNIELIKYLGGEHFNNIPPADLMIDRTFYNIISPDISNKQGVNVILPQDIGHIINRVQVLDDNEAPTNLLPNDMAKYIEMDPTIMVGQEENGNIQHYYYDITSKTLAEIPVGDQSIKINGAKLETLLKTKNISIDDLEQYIPHLTSDNNNIKEVIQPLGKNTTNNINQRDESSPTMPIIIISIILIIIIFIIVGVIYYSRVKNN